MKFKSIYTPAIAVDNVDRMDLVSASRGLGSMALITVCSQASVMKAINIYGRVFGEIVEVDKEYVNDLRTIAVGLMFELNEILCLDMDLVTGVVTSILNRLFPLATLVDSNNYQQLNLLFSNTLVIPEKTMDEINKSNYYSEKVYEAVSNLFNYSERYSVKCDGEYLVVEKL